MKVTITHSIDLEEVPEKASELLIPAEDKLSSSLRWLSSLIRDLSNNDVPALMGAMMLD